MAGDDVAADVKADAAARVTAAVVDGGLRMSVTGRLPFKGFAQANAMVEQGYAAVSSCSFTDPHLSSARPSVHN